MRISTWLRPLIVRLSRPRPRRFSRRPTFRPHLEGLEDRITPSGGGLLDPTFGAGGTVLNSTGTHSQSLTDVISLPDGKLLAAGYMNSTSSGGSVDFAAARYNANGTLDTSFGSGGLATVDFKGSSDRATAVAVQPGTGGKILLAGTAQDKSGDVFGVVRLNSNGTLDTTFGAKGSGGKVTVSPVSRVANEVYDMAVLSDGRFILAGLTKNLGSNANGSITLARFNANGTLDTKFGNNGLVVSSIAVRDSGSPDQHAVRVAVDASGRIVVTATTANSPQDFLVARFNGNGSLDTTFGAAQTGVVRTDILGGSVDTARSLALQGDDKIVVGGLASGVNDGLLALARYNPDGTLDITFDGDGIVTADAVPGYPSGAEADALVVQPDGKIVTAGQGAYLNSGNLLLAMRFNADGSVDTSYGPSGTGAVMTSLGFNSRVSGVALQPDGDLVVAGAMNTSGPTATDPSPYLEYFALVRFTASAAAPSPVQIGSFAASSTTVTAGSPLTLTAGAVTTTNAGATITKVAFYAVDSSGTEQLLDYGTRNADGTWTLTWTPNLSSGRYTLLALAVDSSGAISDPLAINLDVL
ncbi:MAG TPA: hypothetical protein VH643_31905 [Gemmataceae bacterium]|jgi:uncharacterized delta-60 repeat protein